MTVPQAFLGHSDNLETKVTTKNQIRTSIFPTMMHDILHLYNQLQDIITSKVCKCNYNIDYNCKSESIIETVTNLQYNYPDVSGKLTVLYTALYKLCLHC